MIYIQSVDEALLLLKKYFNFIEVFFIKNVSCLLLYKISNYVIDLNDKKPLYRLLYNLLTTKLKVL